ncbi:MAG: DNA mismatch repair protein MutS [Oscillospiraceae bacterium]|jgi:DNA mismatch repair protein MutS|nr:DNA mismatch repair protein MutS [Oscillospiraceae bacterium]
MMRQYFDIKKRNPDSILFFRLGDFYEMFGDDAKLAAKELDIVLTTRDKTGDPNERMPMCGVPYHSAETRIARLISKGYKVAICEQLEDPKDVKGIVDRGVVRVVTPGTLMESSMLDESKSNYLCAVYLGDKSAICFADLSTGDISVTEFPESDISHIENELSTYAPAECIIGGNAEIAGHLIRYLKERHGCLVSHDEERFEEKCSELVRRHFGEEISPDFSQEQKPELLLCSVKAIGALLLYITDTQNTDISHLKTLRRNNDASYMEMDINTMRNLELIASLRTGEKKGSLLWVLDKTKTSMGRRLIRSWILRPLLSTAPLKRRQSAVGELVSKAVNRGELIISLKTINDIERIIGKIVFGNAGCRDLKALSSSIAALPELVSQLTSMKSTALRECAGMDTLSDIAERIDNVIKDDPPFSVREGKFIKDGVDPEVDRLRGLLEHSGAALTGIETRERERTGKKLKIGYNKVFGYYIEIPRSSSDDVPDDYIRKQTLANCERFITQELKELETELLSANDKITALEYKLFEELRIETAEKVGRVQETAKKVAELDVLCSLAETAALNNYCMPEMDVSGIIDIKDGRHPVVETMQQGSLFVPNDTFLDTAGSRTAIITGPNMAGKSTYMRQTALIVLMAQMGSFIPARSARIGIVDRVFTRIGASDDLSAGKSTFMVEMTEVADILAAATRSGLLILDEIGRGTSTYDGMSVARAVLEHCADKRKLGAKTMFATHYHELTALENELDGVKNYNISAKKRGDEIIFLRKIVPGGADDSYGIEVAGLAGVPDSIIKRAKAVLKALESGGERKQGDGSSAFLFAKKQKNRPLAFSPRRADSDTEQMSLLDLSGSEIATELKATDLNTLTPLEALSMLFEMKKKL